MANKTLADVIDRLKAEGQLTRNSGTNSIKSIKTILEQQSADRNADRLSMLEEKRETAVREARKLELLEAISRSPAAEGGPGEDGGGFSLLGLGGALAGGGIGLGAAGAGLGAFFMGLAGAEAIMANFGNGDNIKSLLTNLAEGLSAFETRDLAAIGAVLGMGAVAGAVPGLSGPGAGLGMAAVGAGLGGFFAGLAAADTAMSWMNTDMTALKNAMGGLSDALGEMDATAFTAVGGLLAAGGAAGALFGPSRVAKATIGMGALGLGIGAFFAGLAAGDAAASWMNADGVALKNIMTNLSEGLAAFGGRDLAALGGLLAAGGLFGAVPGGAAAAGGAALGMGAIGLGLGAFFTGFAAVGTVASFIGADGGSMKSIMVNLAEGLSAFGDVDASNLLALAPALTLLGPAMLTFLGSEGIADIFGGTKEALQDAWNWITGSEDGSDTQSNRIQQIADMLQPLNDINADSLSSFNALTDVLERFADSVRDLAAADIGDVKDNIAEMAETITWALPLFDKMANGGVIGAGWGDGYAEMDFGGGLLDPNLRLGELMSATGQMNAIMNNMTADGGEMMPPTVVEPVAEATVAQVNALTTEEQMNDRMREQPAVAVGGSTTVVAPQNNSSTVMNRGGDVNINDRMMDPHNPDQFRDYR